MHRVKAQGLVPCGDLVTSNRKWFWPTLPERMLKDYQRVTEGRKAGELPLQHYRLGRSSPGTVLWQGHPSENSGTQMTWNCQHFHFSSERKQPTAPPNTWPGGGGQPDNSPSWWIQGVGGLLGKKIGVLWGSRHWYQSKALTKSRYQSPKIGTDFLHTPHASCIFMSRYMSVHILCA